MYVFATSTYKNPVFLTPGSPYFPALNPQPISAAFAVCFLLGNGVIPYLRSHSCFHECMTSFPLHSLHGMMFWAHCCSLLLKEMSTKWDILSRQEIGRARTLQEKAGGTQICPHTQLQVQLHIWWEIRGAEKCPGRADEHSHSTTSRFVVKFCFIHRLKDIPVNPHHKWDDNPIPCQLSCSKLINMVGWRVWRILPYLELSLLCRGRNYLWPLILLKRFTHCCQLGEMTGK